MIVVTGMTLGKDKPRTKEDVIHVREEILKKAKEGPGVSEMMELYGRYNELMMKTNYYFRTRTKRFTTVSNSTS